MPLGIQYRAVFLSGILKGFSDADHGGDVSHSETGRSTSGVVCRCAGGAISWLSQTQALVVISTTEAELVTASVGAQKLIWLTQILEELTNLKEVPSSSVGNEAAVRLAHNPEFHMRTKHIHIRYFFARELVLNGTIDVK